MLILLNDLHSDKTWGDFFNFCWLYNIHLIISLSHNIHKLQLLDDSSVKRLKFHTSMVPSNDVKTYWVKGKWGKSHRSYSWHMESKYRCLLALLLIFLKISWTCPRYANREKKGKSENLHSMYEAIMVGGIEGEWQTY